LKIRTRVFIHPLLNQFALSNRKSNDELIHEYLNQMNWEPESEMNENGLTSVQVKVQLDYKLANLYLRYEEDGLWLSIISVFMSDLGSNLSEIYKKILEINFSTTMTKFGLSDGKLYGLVELPLYSLDFSEFQAGIRRLTNDLNKYYPIVKEIMNL